MLIPLNNLVDRGTKTVLIMYAITAAWRKWEIHIWNSEIYKSPTFLITKCRSNILLEKVNMMDILSIQVREKLFGKQIY